METFHRDDEIMNTVPPGGEVNIHQGHYLQNMKHDLLLISSFTY